MIDWVKEGSIAYHRSRDNRNFVNGLYGPPFSERFYLH